MDARQYRPVIEDLERGPSLVAPLIHEVPEAVRKRRPRPEKWSAHEHACHLAEVHPMILGRLDLMLAQDHPVIRSYSPDAETPGDVLLKADLEESLDRYARDRARLVERARALTAEQWDRTGQHDEYRHYSIFIMLRHIALHDRLHAYRIEELLLKKDWE